MKNTMLALSLASLSMAGHAAGEPARFMLGGSLALEHSNFIDDVNDELAGTGLSLDDQGASVGSDVYAGVAVSGLSTLRLGYHRFGNQRGDISTGGLKVGDTELQGDGLYLAFDAMLPVSQQVFLGGTLGLQDWHGEATVAAGAVSEQIRDDARNVFLGVGGKVLLGGGGGAVTFGYTYYTFDEENSNDSINYDSFHVGMEAYF
ncbi:MAG: hypothetical protein R3292_08420 [Alcanivorax sp.]|nr:hypothetical protein [Alcanivorax sp.]